MVLLRTIFVQQQRSKYTNSNQFKTEENIYIIYFKKKKIKREIKGQRYISKSGFWMQPQVLFPWEMQKDLMSSSRVSSGVASKQNKAIEGKINVKKRDNRKKARKKTIWGENKIQYMDCVGGLMLSSLLEHTNLREWTANNEILQNFCPYSNNFVGIT